MTGTTARSLISIRTACGTYSASVGADRGTALKCNGLFLQQPDGTFADVAYQWNIGDAAGRGRFCAVLDANNDGYPDIFYGTDPVRVDGLPSINRFYLNTGQGSFIDSPAMGLNLNIGAQSARTVDYNSDGWPDLLICGYTGGLRLFKNNQGHGFTDVSSILGPSVNAVDAVMVDVNHDSRPDLIVLTKTAVKLILQNADGTFAKPKTILKLDAEWRWRSATSTATTTRTSTSSAARPGAPTRRTTC